MSDSADIHVLHVDDDPDFVEVTAEMLEREDDRFSVDTATSASEGLEQNATTDYDCIVSDYDMPGQDGIEFLETIREKYPDFPVILYTGKGSEEVASDAISAGATDYLQKGRGTDQYELLADRIQNAVDQHRAQEEVAETEQRLQTIVESTTEVLWEFTADWDELLFINSAYEEVWGRSISELRDHPQSFLDGVHPNDRASVKTAMEQLSAGEPVDIEFRVNADRDFGRWVWVQGEPVCDDAGEITKVVGFARDITERKEWERELERYKAYLEESNDVIAVFDESGNITYESPAISRILGYEQGELVGQNGFDFIHPDDEEEVYDTITQLASEPGATATAEYRFRTADGQWCWLEARGTNHLDTDPINGIITNNRDITDRKERERRLQQYKTLVEGVGDPMYSLDDEGYIDMVNEAMCERFKADREQVVGTHVSEYMIESDYKRATTLIQDLISNPDQDQATCEVTLTTTAGGQFPAEVNLGILTDETGDYQGCVGVVRDIGDRKRREEMLSALHDATQEFMDATDKQAVADRAVETTRIVLDQPINGLWLHDSDDDVLRPVAMTEKSAELLDELPTYTGGESLSWQAFKDGEIRVYDDVRTEPDRLRAEPAIRSEIIIPLGEHGVMNIGATEPAHFSAIDISVARILGNTVEAALARAEREQHLRTQHAELHRQNERLEKFTSVVSHDLRNPLQVADTRLELAQSECDSPHLDDVADALDRMETLIEDLLTLARQGEQVQETEPVLLAEMVEGCWQSVQTADATLVCDTEHRIQADSSRLKQLLENLIRNAVEHGGEDVTITVGDLDAGFYVADDGPGIPADERDEVFEAGYSTADEGTGFGLNIVQEIVEAHGWEITVTDSETDGARFEITGVESA